MTKTTEEKVALVTGSAMGIGLACAEAFAKAGYITVLADIREPREQVEYLQPIITQYFIDNKSEIWLLFLIAHSKR